MKRTPPLRSSIRRLLPALATLAAAPTPALAAEPAAPGAPAAAPPPAPSAAPPAPSAAPPAPSAAPPAHCPEPSCPTPEWRAVIAAGAALGLEVGSEPAPAFWLSGEARSERWSLGVEARGVFPASAYRLRDGVSTVDVALYSGLAVPCVRWRWLAGCALVEVGGLWVAGPGMAGDPAAPFIGLGLRARADFPLPAGLEVRVTGEGIGHVLGLAAQGDDTSGAAGVDPTPFTFDAPRRVSAYLAVGLAKVF